MKALIWSLFALPLLLSYSSEGVQASGTIAVIKSSEYRNSTVFDFYDGEMNYTDSLSTKYPNISFGGYENSCKVDKKIFFNPRGLLGKLDFGKIICMDLKTEEFSEYDFNRVNITAFTADREYLIASSNLNGVCYVDRYTFESGEIQSIQTEEVLFDSMAVIDDTTYAIGFDTEMVWSLYQLDFENQDYEPVLKIGKDIVPSFLTQYNEKLYYASDGILYVYGCDGEVEKLYLTYTDPFNMLAANNRLYIGYTDLSPSENNIIEIYDLKTMELLMTINHPGTVLQMEVPSSDESALYVRDYEKLTEYSLQGDTYNTVFENELKTNGDYFVGGFFTVEDNS